MSTGGTPGAQVWDCGAQPERTALAWRRTTMAFAAAGVALPRVWWGALGWWGVLPSAALLICAATVWWASHRRYTRAHQGLLRANTLVTGGWLLIVPVLGCVTLGAGALVVVLRS